MHCKNSGTYLLSQPPQPLVLRGHLPALVVLLPQVLEPLLLGDEHLLLRLDLRLLPVRHLLQLVAAQVREGGLTAASSRLWLVLLVVLLVRIQRVPACKIFPNVRSNLNLHRKLTPPNAGFSMIHCGNIFQGNEGQNLSIFIWVIHPN